MSRFQGPVFNPLVPDPENPEGSKMRQRVRSGYPAEGIGESFMEVEKDEEEGKEEEKRVKHDSIEDVVMIWLCR